MPNVRHPAVAGTFYPNKPMTLQQSVAQYIDAAHTISAKPKAIIAPHAGFIYSGPVAGSIYKTLAQRSSQITRVVLLGPSHRLAFSGCALSSADIYVTPLGNINIDKKAADSIRLLPFVQELDAAHLEEHSLELQLPFLQVVLPQFLLLPIVVGNASPEQIATLLDHVWRGDETLIIVSSDLSHYHAYEIAQQLDQNTSTAIENLCPANIGHEQACGFLPVNGLLLAAKQHNMSAKTIDLRNSGDTAGSKSQVVGYGAYVFE